MPILIIIKSNICNKHTPAFFLARVLLIEGKGGVMRKHTKRKTAWVLMLAVGMLLTAFPEPSQASSDICLKALEKCGVDVVISFLLGGIQGAALMATGCFNGYIFCLKYYAA